MFIMKCPVHTKEELQAEKAIKKRASGNDADEKVTVFFCPYCDCYYVPTEKKQEDKKKIGKLKGKKVFCTTNPVMWLVYDAPEVQDH